MRLGGHISQLTGTFHPNYSLVDPIHLHKIQSRFLHSVLFVFHSTPTLFGVRLVERPLAHMSRRHLCAT